MTGPWPSPAPKRSGLAVAGIVAALVGLLIAFLVVIGLMAGSLGAGALLLCALAALVPLAIVLGGALWVDRWEPEPKLALLLAWLWGAAASVVITLLLQLPVIILTGGSGAGEVVDAVVFAPIAEETAKGLGLLLVLLLWRRTFDGPIDGIVYGMVIGGGFAFTENILYFGESFFSGAAVFTMTFFTRGLLSPFAHAMFTACTGFALGLAVSRGRRPLGLGLLGLLAAISLHFLWNLSTFIDFFGLYLLVQVPLFASAIGGVFVLQRRERRVTEQRLAEYSAAGWLSAEEVRLCATPRGRAQLRAWARAGGPAWEQGVAVLLRDTNALANLRHRAVAGGPSAAQGREEAELLQRIAQTRAVLFSAPPPPRVS